MQNKAFKMGPAYIASSAANILNPGTTTGGVNSTASPYDKLRIILYHIRITNSDSVARTATLFIGATGGSAGGTEFAFNAKSIPANDSVDWNGRMPLETADFLSGIASAASKLTITIEGEIGLA